MKNRYTLHLACALLASFISCNANTDQRRAAITEPQTNAVYTTKTAPDTKNIQVAVLLDTSNSMDGLIDQAKAQLWKIVNELSYAECAHKTIKLQIALYEYGNDGLPAREGYIRQVLPFSEDLDQISKELFALTTNGGNEYCGKAILTGINQLDWRKNNDDLKLMFIAGNEPFTQGPVSYTDAAVDAKEKGITINTIFCGDYQQGVATQWKQGAVLTGGEYSAIDQNRKTIHIATPYDDLILKLNHQLNNTYIYYGHEGKKRREMQATQDSNALIYSTANAVSRTVSKSSKFYKNKSWDLVDAISDDTVALEEVETEALPEPLQGKSTKEMKQFIEAQKEKRVAIQQQIQELNAKRLSHIQQQQPKDTSNLETALLKAIKKQGAKKALHWK